MQDLYECYFYANCDTSAAGVNCPTKTDIQVSCDRVLRQTAWDNGHERDLLEYESDTLASEELFGKFETGDCHRFNNSVGNEESDLTVYNAHSPLPSTPIDSSEASVASPPTATPTSTEPDGNSTHLYHLVGTGRYALIERRNQRERVRVRAVNEAFARLRQVVPSTRLSPKRVSKVKTLKRAVEYIGDLQRRLATFEGFLLNDGVVLADSSRGTTARWKRLLNDRKPV